MGKVDRRNFIRILTSGAAVATFPAACISSAAAKGTRSYMRRTTPEQQGIPSQAISGFITEVSKLDSLHSVMIARNDCVVAEGWWAPYEPELNHWLFSVSKSVTAIGVGLARSEGLLSLDDAVTSFFPGEMPDSPGPHLLEMRVRDLLTMTHGHGGNTDRDVMRADTPTWIRSFLSIEPTHPPGSAWHYSNAVSYMLSAIVQQVSGERLVDFLMPRLFEPLGVRNPVWDESPEGVTLGASGLRMRTEDVTRFGQLCLQLGSWNGVQLVPESWIIEATKEQATPPSQDPIDGYGFHFTIVPHQAAYAAGGVFGQNCIVVPEKQAVVVTTAGVRHGEMQAINDLVWKHLTPSMSDSQLPQDQSASSHLSARMDSLFLPTVDGLAQPPVVAGWTRSFHFAENDRGISNVVFRLAGDSLDVTIVNRSGNHLIRCGCGSWYSQITGFEPPALTSLGVLGDGSSNPCASSAAWTSKDSLKVRVCYTETPFIEELNFKFTSDSVTFEQVANLSLHGWDARHKATISGRET